MLLVGRMLAHNLAGPQAQMRRPFAASNECEFARWRSSGFMAKAARNGYGSAIIGDRVLRFDNVGLRYGMGPEVVSDLNFSIAPQSFQFVTGPSGAGKTTLLRLMLLSLRPTRGTIHIFGQDAAALSKAEVTALRRRIGVVFQDFRLLDHLTTYENVALPLRAMGRAESDYRAEVIELLRWVGLGDRINASPVILSGGEKQRAAIARALIVRPELLLADEPTGNVDPGLARRLLRLFIELHRLGTAVVIATHDLPLMDQFSFARRLVVGNGRVVTFDGVST